MGEILTFVGIATFIGLFHRNLYTLKDPQRIRKSSIFLSNRFIFACVFGSFVCILSAVLKFGDGKNSCLTHAQILLYVMSMCIFVPRYYIAQNENLELYVSVYHQIPAPVLPWQIPENFNHKSVQLNFIKSKNWILESPISKINTSLWRFFFYFPTKISKTQTNKFVNK